MTSQHQQRDSRGRFTRSVQPQQPIEEQPQPTPPPQASTSRFGRYQRALVAASAPITSSIVPVAERIVNIASALQLSSPDSPNILPSHPRDVPPPRYVTEPPLPPPDFDVTGSNESPPCAPSPSQPDIDIPHQPAPDLGDNEQVFPPLPQHPPRTPPLPAQQLPRARPSPPLPPLPQPLPPPPPPPPAPQPAVNMAHAPAQGAAAMPSARSRLAPHFSGCRDSLLFSSGQRRGT